MVVTVGNNGLVSDVVSNQLDSLIDSTLIAIIVVIESQ
jgi:hypothetical protein